MFVFLSTILLLIPSSTSTSAEIDSESLEDYPYEDYSDNVLELGNFVLSQEEEALLLTGVELDYTYNESRSIHDNPDKLISSPGCPISGQTLEEYPENPFNRNVWVHYGSPPKCFLTGIKGPCPSKMVMAPLLDSKFGTCRCDCGAEIDKPLVDTKERFCFDERFRGHYGFYEDVCYRLLEQGPCRSEEWLIFNAEKNGLTCEIRECKQVKKTFDNPFGVYFPISNSNIYNERDYSEEREDYINETLQNSVNVCVKLGTLCMWVMGDMFKVVISRDNPFPHCGGFPGPVRSSLGFLAGNACIKDNQMFSNNLGRCVPYRRGKKAPLNLKAQGYTPESTPSVGLISEDPAPKTLSSEGSTTEKSNRESKSNKALSSHLVISLYQLALVCFVEKILTKLEY